MAQRELENELDVLRSRLAQTIARWTRKDGDFKTPDPDLTLCRRDDPTEPTAVVYEPSLSLVIQGCKQVVLADETFVYTPDDFLITLVDIPTVGRVLEASPERPLLAVLLKLDPRAIAQLIIDSDLPPLSTPNVGRAMTLSPVSLPLLSAVQRLLDLLDSPRDLPILGPLIQREILYRLLCSEQGNRLRQIGSVGSQGHQIARAIDWLKAHYAEPLNVQLLATRVGMSPSAFHHHFRTLTSLSPLQYQKKLRLHEARRLMLVEQADSGTAGLRVGYESPSQFSREYSRLFGDPPLRDISHLRQLGTLGALV